MSKKTFFHGYQPINIFDWMDNMANVQKNTIRLCQEMEQDINRLQLELKELQVELEELRDENRR